MLSLFVGMFVCFSSSSCYFLFSFHLLGIECTTEKKFLLGKRVISSAQHSMDGTAATNQIVSTTKCLILNLKQNNAYTITYITFSEHLHRTIAQCPAYSYAPTLSATLRVNLKSCTETCTKYLTGRSGRSSLFGGAFCIVQGVCSHIFTESWNLYYNLNKQ